MAAGAAERSGGGWGWIKKDLFLGCPLLQEGKGQKKNPGVELLSRTLLCSTIVARPLIDRVRDGNVSFKPAMNTGKKYEMKKGIGGWKRDRSTTK